MFGGDTTWYHMPFSAFIAQEHSTVPLHFTDPLRLAAWFYPASTELVNGATIVLFKSDWLAPLQNLIWLPIALLAAWCVGRPYKVGPATLVAAAIVLDAGVMIETQPGEARNDIMGLAFLLAFAAFLINGHQRRAPDSGAVQDTPERDAPLLDKGPLVMAGIAAGLAASVKFTFLVPVVAITVGVVLFSGKGRRWTTAWVMALPMLVVGGYWYLRAAIKTGGNPIPITKFGPLNLPTPDQMPLDPRPRFAVAHYIGDPTMYRRWFFPELDNAFGPLWPLILIVAVCRRRLHRLALAQPDPARGRGRGAGDRGRLRLHAADRGRAGGLADRVLHQHPLPGPGAGAGDGAVADRAAAARAGPACLADATLLNRGLRDHGAARRRAGSRRYIVGTVFLTLLLVWAPAALGLGRARGHVSRAVVAAAAAVLVLLAVVLGRAQQVQYAEQHYRNPLPFLGEGGPRRAYDVRPQAGATNGSGSSAPARSSSASTASTAHDLNNDVEFIGVRRARTGPTACRPAVVSCVA